MRREGAAGRAVQSLRPSACDRRRDPGEVPRARHPRAEPADARIQGCEHCPRGNLMPVLGSGHPQADIFLLKFEPQPAEIEEGVAFYGRAGQRPDEELQAARDRPAGRLRHGVRQMPRARHRRVGARMPRACARGDRDRAAAYRRSDGRGGARGAEQPRGAARRASSSRRPGRSSRSRLRARPSYVPDIDSSLDDEKAKREFWGAFRALGEWYADLPPY